MQLDKIQAKIRPRNHWEAIDLGFVFARQWFWQLWFSWIMLALPVFIIFHIIFSDKIWLASICLWWFKPLYEQPLLFILSRRLFAEEVDFKFIRKHLFSIVKPQLLASLSWRRLSVNRSFNNPVAMLEKLSGKARTNRLKLLHRQQKVSSWLTIFGAHIEAIFNFSIIAIMTQLIPSETNWLELNDFFDQASDQYQLAAWMGNVAYFFSISIFAPFYVGAGFSLYLYSRVKLEGWEIEITFRQLKQRLEKLKPISLILIAVIISGSLLPVQPGYAETTVDLNPIRVTLNAEQARQSIAKILQQQDFGTESMVTKWRLINADTEPEKPELPEWLSRFFEWLINSENNSDDETSIWKIFNIAFIIEIVLWLTAAAGIYYLWKLLWPKYRSFSHSRSPPEKLKKNFTGTTLLAQQLELDKLPDDILSQVRKYSNNGQFRAAVGLLYRAALNTLIEKNDLRIPFSATETDCMRIVDELRPTQESGYFKRLTRSWLVIAYGHDVPREEDVFALSREWEQFYGTTE